MANLVKKTVIPLASSQAGDGSSLAIELLYANSTTDNATKNTVLFLPFWGGSASTFQPLLQLLAQRPSGSNYVAMSYAGTGGSSRPIDDSSDAHSIISGARRVLDVILGSDFQRLFQPSKLTICAHSMSAKIVYTVLELLAKDNRRKNLSINALVLLGPAPVEPLYLPKELQEQQPKVYENLENAKKAVSEVLTSKTLSQEVIDTLAADAVNMSPGAKQGWRIHGMIHDCAESVPALNRTWRNLKVMVLAGENDVVETPEKIREQTVKPLLAAGLDVDMRILPACGHLLPIEATDEVAHYVEELCKGV